MPSREPMSLRATDHGVIPKEYTNEGRVLLYFNYGHIRKEIQRGINGLKKL